MPRLKQTMLDYLVAHLEPNYKVDVVSKQFPDFPQKTKYLKLNGNDGLVLCLEHAVGMDNYNRLRNSAHKQYEQVAVVFFKDGKTYFRSAARKAHFKQAGRSLKHYSSSQVNKMLELRPEERQRSKIRPLQYFQPDSARLDEMVLSYRVAPVHFDYSHVVGNIKPHNGSSKRIYLITNKQEHKGDLLIDNHQLIDA